MAVSSPSSLFVPSPYQEAIFAFLEAGRGNGLVRAAAGAGKTSTIIAACQRLPEWQRQRTLLLAYNAHIRDELKERAPYGVQVLTNHQLGMRAISAYFTSQGLPTGGQNWVNKWKYPDLINLYWRNVLTADPRGSRAALALGELLGLIRLNLVDGTDTEAAWEVAQRYGVEIRAQDEETVLGALPTILLWGREGLPRDLAMAGGTKNYHPSRMIDFDDMLWLPHVLPGVTFPQYDLVMADECQDLSKAQLETALKAVAPGGRTLMVGDPNQAIYAFAGADASAYDAIKDRTNAVELPLTVCYRCARKVVEAAAAILPGIEAKPNAPEGIVETITEAGALQMIRPGDALLCRINAPLVAAAFELIRRGIPAKVLGRDIGARVLRTLDDIALVEGFTFQKLPTIAAQWLSTRLSILAQRKDSEDAQIALTDQVETVTEVWGWCKGKGASSAAEMRVQIEQLFSDEASAVTLSSIHKSKGLEWNRVFILKPSKLPHPMARTEGAQIQEINLKYVAYTRAERELYIALEPGKKVVEPALDLDEQEVTL